MSPLPEEETSTRGKCEREVPNVRASHTEIVPRVIEADRGGLAILQGDGLEVGQLAEIPQPHSVVLARSGKVIPN